MRVIAIEEHFMTPDGFAITEWNGKGGKPITVKASQLGDIGMGRIVAMDAAGIDVQVLSTPAIGMEELAPAEAIAMTRATNDALAEAIAEHADRFAGFAVLPAIDPAAAAAELDRAVTGLGFKGALMNGHVRGRFLDEQAFWPIFECAQALDVPIYLHPTPPPEAVKEAYYSGLPGTCGASLSQAAWGWHCETGLHALRLVAGGVFDRFQRLQVILGHMGENIPFSLARADRFLTPHATHLNRRVADYFHDNFSITISGYYTAGPLLCALMVLGADRIMFATDYPFGDAAEGREFLDTAPISPGDRAKIAHGNAERLLRM
jgi:predicted TIM-barrel fold metal-dependent hydrolase